MKDYITITSKGQMTIPVAFRKRLGVPSRGGTLRVRLDLQTNEVVLSKPMTFEELAERTSRHIKPGTKPLIDVSGYYQRHRPTGNDFL